MSDMTAPLTSSWRDLASTQGGLITREQLRLLGLRPWSVSHRVDTERWQLLTPTVIATFTGDLTREQLAWLGVLHGGPGSLVAGLTAAELAGLRNWHRDEVCVIVPYANDVPSPFPGLSFARSRRDLARMAAGPAGVPRCQIEPAILMWGARERSPRSGVGVLAAAVQQQLTTPARLSEWLMRLRPLRRAAIFSEALVEMSGGAQSAAELDVGRLCREFGLAPPTRQVARRDATGRVRYTDCEWKLSHGRTLVLEVDGSFHMDVDHWEDDIARQRALTTPDRIVIRCTSRELRDNRERVARDLRILGVPPAA